MKNYNLRLSNYKSEFLMTMNSNDILLQVANYFKNDVVDSILGNHRIYNKEFFGINRWYYFEGALITTVAIKITARMYNPRTSLLCKRDFSFRGSYFYEKCRCISK